MPTNVYFSHGTKNEQYLVEDLIIESLKIYGNEFMYIPRTLVSKDEILGEDRLSQFTSSFPIEMYFENVDSFAGQGAFIQKFGLMMEQSAKVMFETCRARIVLKRSPACWPVWRTHLAPVSTPRSYFRSRCSSNAVLNDRFDSHGPSTCD
jgi:hypothetical protein